MRLSWAAVAVLAMVTTGARAVEPVREMVYEKAPFPSAHASTVVEVGGGAFLAAWFGGTGEGKPDVAIWMARRESRGGWSAPVEMVREPGVPCWNPVLFHAAGRDGRPGRLWLYYKFGPSYTWWTAGRRWSDDDGRTWSAVEHLPAGEIGPVRAKPLLLPDGAIVAGSSVESYGSWAAWVERSGDGGRTWLHSGPVTLASLETAAPTGRVLQGGVGADGKVVSGAAAGTEPQGLIQPVVVAMDDDGRHLRLYARSSGDVGRVCVADSEDGGRTWGPARPIDVPNPNAGIDAVRLRDGRIVLLYNDAGVGKGETAGPRTPLSLAVSRDGEHFTKFKDVETGPGEFSYPAMVLGTDGALHMTYTWNRKGIRYVVVPGAEVP